MESPSQVPSEVYESARTRNPQRLTSKISSSDTCDQAEKYWFGFEKIKNFLWQNRKSALCAVYLMSMGEIRSLDVQAINMVKNRHRHIIEIFKALLKARCLSDERFNV